jgi:hypothetical protein
MKAQLIFAAALLSLSATANANAKPILSPQINDILLEVCVNTQNDDKFGFEINAKSRCSSLRSSGFFIGWKSYKKWFRADRFFWRNARI